MVQTDYREDKLRKKEKAEEDRYFAERDRQLIEKLHRQHKQRPSEKTEVR